MNKKNITVFALAALAILNVIIVIMIISNRVDSTYHSERETAELSAILDQGGISADVSVLPRQKPGYHVYSEKVSDDGFLSAMTGIFGEGSVDDGAFIQEKDGRTLKIGRDFAFEMSASGYSAPYGDMTTVKNETRSRLEKKVLSFLGLDRSVATPAAISYKTESAFEYGSGQTQITVREYVGGIMTENVITAVFSGDELEHANGRALLIRPTEDYTAKLCDCFDIMIKEKKYFSINGAARMTAEKIEYIYDTCFDVLGAVYLIPACSVQYTDGTVHIYDLVSGNLIQSN